jgi:hypothetical protein
MGWEEGKGLGRENKGIVKHIWTKKRNDQVRDLASAFDCFSI